MTPQSNNNQKEIPIVVALKDWIKQVEAQTAGNRDDRVENALRIMRSQLHSIIEAHSLVSNDKTTTEYKITVCAFAMSMVTEILRVLKDEDYITGIKCKYEDGEAYVNLDSSVHKGRGMQFGLLAVGALATGVAAYYLGWMLVVYVAAAVAVGTAAAAAYFEFVCKYSAEQKKVVTSTDMIAQAVDYINGGQPGSAA